MPTTIVIDGVTLILKKYPEFAAGNPTATDITLFSDPVNGDLFKTTMDNFIANVLHVDGVTITGDGSSGNPLVSSGGSDTNFAITDLTATGNRSHSFGSFKLSITGSKAGDLMYIENITDNFDEVVIHAFTNSGMAIIGETQNSFGVVAKSTGTSGNSDPYFSANTAGLFASSNEWNHAAKFYTATPTGGGVGATLTLTNTPTVAAVDGVGCRIMFCTPPNYETGPLNEIMSQRYDDGGGNYNSVMTINGWSSAGVAANLKLYGGNKAVALIPVSVTVAASITPADGMIVYVSNTDATFTAVGFWGYVNGTWTQL